MPVDITLQDVINSIDDFADAREWDQFHSPKNLSASITIEANELLEIFLWNDPSREELLNNDSMFQNTSEEIADVMIYCLRFCSTLGLDPLSIITSKLQTNERKYPVNKSKGSSLKSVTKR